MLLQDFLRFFGKTFYIRVLSIFVRKCTLRRWVDKLYLCLIIDLDLFFFIFISDGYRIFSKVSMMDGINQHHEIKGQVVDIALELPEKPLRELAWRITDTQEYYNGYKKLFSSIIM